MPHVAVVIPWRGGCLHRLASLVRTMERLRTEHPTWQVLLGETPADEPWCKATAVAAAVDRTAAQVLVLHDADVWCDGLADAVTAVGPDCRWAIPHLMVHRLAEGQHEPTTDRQLLDGKKPPYIGWAGGGILVIDRAAYEQCPLDPRFIGWGREDISHAHALTILFGAPWRGTADLWHWWHPPQPRPSRGCGSPATERLAQRYTRAAGILEGRRIPGDRAAMTVLIEEARAMADRIKLDHDGIAQVLKSQEVAQAIEAKAQEVANAVSAAAPELDEVVVDRYETDRAAASVTIKDARGRVLEVRDGILSKAARGAGLEVNTR